MSSSAPPAPTLLILSLALFAGRAATQDPARDPAKAPDTSHDHADDHGPGRSDKRTLANLLDELTPTIEVYGDFVYRGVKGTLRNDFGDDIGDRFALRETEFHFRLDHDSGAYAVAVATAAEERPNEYEFAMEELYAGLETPVPGLAVRAGRFRTAIGRNNLLHTHALPTASRPLVISSFLGEEGDAQNGAGISWASSSDNGSLELTYQLVNGENETFLAGSDSDHLAHVAHVCAHVPAGGVGHFELGATAVAGRATSSSSSTSTLVGADLRWHRELAGESSVELVAEGYHLRRELAVETVHSNGAYGLATWYLGHDWAFAARGDWTEFADADTGHASSVSGWTTWQAADFVRVRVGAEQLDDPRQSDVDWVFWIQTTITLGAGHDSGHDH